MIKIISVFLLLVQTPFAHTSTFLWGVSNSAFQVEGTPQDSDWYRWTKTPGKIKDNTNADKVSDFWNQYEKDFDLAREAGLNAFRMSIAWDRLEPKEDVWNESALSHYETMIVQMRARGLEPVITLHHFVLPQWLADKGGLLAKDFVPQFATYAEKVVKRLGVAPAKVNLWMTFNEPMILLRSAYLTTDWPPALGDSSKAMEAGAQIARAHIEAVRKIRALDYPNVKISIAKNWQYFESANYNPLSYAAVMLLEWIFNHQILSALTTGKISFWMPGAKKVKDKVTLPEGRSTLDYLGINNYGRWLVTFVAKKPFFSLSEGEGTKTDMGWEIYPKALYESIRKASSYGLPILISENGIADAKDKNRPQFLKEHLEYVEKAQLKDYDVFGYLYWSLTDNFEWSHGLTPKFGLVEIDYKTGKRIPRPSYEIYKGLIKHYRAKRLEVGD